ncbi:MAG: CorA family divalent cation transporter [bacterium]
MKHTVTSKGLTWVNVQSPESRELVEFVREAGLTPTDAEFVAERHHRPEVAVRDDYLFLLIQIPVFDRKVRVTHGVSVFFVVKRQQLFSLHYEPLVVLDKIRQDFELSPEQQEEYFADEGLALCLYIISSLNETSFHKLERLAKHIDIAEDAIFQGYERKMVEEISVLTRDVMDFRKIIRPHTRLFAAVPRHVFITPAVAAKWQRVHGQLLRMWETLESMFESVRELSNANFTMLQYKENELLRLLTIYSIVVIPMLVLVGPFFNPRAANATMVDNIAFWVVVGLMTITLLFILIKAGRKRLL